MSEADHGTALVTGANSGLGFEASAQLAEQGNPRVIITARTAEKAASTREQLLARTGADVFETLVLDFDDLTTVKTGAAELEERGGEIDVLLLNAGMAPTIEVQKTAQGIEATVASTLVGHHLLTTELLEAGLLSDRARIVIAGSEAARGDIPTFNPLDVDAFAAEHLDGDLEAAIQAQLLMEPPATYKPSDVYATAKMFVVWWAAALARQLPAGMTVNAVSPGSTPYTDAQRNAPLYMRYLMVPLFRLLPGMSHSLEDGAGRYLEAAGYGDDITGRFFASPPKKMTGPLVENDLERFDNPALQQALITVTSKTATAQPNSQR